jgi:hypothetical protein
LSQYWHEEEVAGPEGMGEAFLPFEQYIPLCVVDIMESLKCAVRLFPQMETVSYQSGVTGQDGG